MRKILFLVFMGLIFSGLPTDSLAKKTKLVPVSWKDLNKISQKMDVPFSILVLLMNHEEGYVGLKRKNDNGTYDLGPFQVNTCHLKDPFLKELGITADDLQNNGILNALVGAYIYRDRFVSAESHWDAIGNYHSYTPEVKRKYQRDFLKSTKAFTSVKDVLTYANKEIERN